MNNTKEKLRRVGGELVQAAVVAQPLRRNADGSRDWTDTLLAAVAGLAVWAGVTLATWLVIQAVVKAVMR